MKFRLLFITFFVCLEIYSQQENQSVSLNIGINEPLNGKSIRAYGLEFGALYSYQIRSKISLESGIRSYHFWRTGVEIQNGLYTKNGSFYKLTMDIPIFVKYSITQNKMEFKVGLSTFGLTETYTEYSGFDPDGSGGFLINRFMSNISIGASYNLNDEIGIYLNYLKLIRSVNSSVVSNDKGFISVGLKYKLLNY